MLQALYNHVFALYYGGYLEMAQKAIEGANVTCWNMHVILRWLKIGFIEFLLKFGLKQ